MDFFPLYHKQLLKAVFKSRNQGVGIPTGMAVSITFSETPVWSICADFQPYNSPHTPWLWTGLVFQRPQVWGMKLPLVLATTYLASLLPCCSTPENVVVQCPVLAGIFVFSGGGFWPKSCFHFPEPPSSFQLLSLSVHIGLPAPGSQHPWGQSTELPCPGPPH